MRKNTIYLSIYLGSLVIFGSCSAPVGVTTSSPSEPIPVNFTPREDGSIQSYAADVETWSTNSRIAGSTQLMQRYRMAVKLIDGQLYTRKDFSADSGLDGRTRAVVASGTEMVFLDATGGVEMRLPAPTLPAGLDSLPAMKTLSPRIQAGQLLDTAKKLGWDSVFENNGTTLRLQLPVADLGPDITARMNGALL